MSPEYQRIFEVAKRHFGGVGKLSLLMGKSKHFLGAYKNRRGFGMKVLLELEAIGINPRYITHGEEPMLLRDPEFIEMENINLPEKPDLSKLNLEQLIKWRDEVLPLVEKINKIEQAYKDLETE